MEMSKKLCCLSIFILLNIMANYVSRLQLTATTLTFILLSLILNEREKFSRGEDNMQGKCRI